MGFDLDSWLKERALEVEAWLSLISSELVEGEAASGGDPRCVPKSLSQAMSYALMGGGKRLRPALVIAAAEAVDSSSTGRPGERPELLRHACCAVELIHNYSLVHDDLPAMDDDDMRRGRPTCHRVHGEAMAILAGDALLTDAFALLAGGHGRATGTDIGRSEAETRIRLVARLSAAAGSAGMVGGQALDITRVAVGKGLGEVERVHLLKTGALFSYSCAAGAEVARASGETVDRLARFGETIGLAFQIADDILDETGDAASMGKAVGKDRDRDTATVTRAIGLEAAGARASALVDEALSLIGDLGDGALPLRALAERLVRRKA